MRWIFGVIAALALSTIASAQANIRSTQAAMSDEPAHTALPIPECVELGEEDQAAYDALLEKPVYFDDLFFDCESDWLYSETVFAPALKSLGESPLAETKDYSKAPTVTLRRLSWGDYNGRNYKLSRLDCGKSADGKALNGTFLLDEKNPWSKPNNGRWLLKLTAADCRFIMEMLDELEPIDVRTTLPCDSSGTIYLHTNTVITEFKEYSKGGYLRFGYCDLIDDDPKSQAAETFLDQLFLWLDGRARESGRKVRR